MTTNVITVRENARVEDAARLLARHRISGMPVLDGSGMLMGMISEYDLIARQGQRVSDIMSRSVVSISADTEIEEVLHLLTNENIRRTPVMEGNLLVGIISRSDLVRQIAMRWVCPTCGEDVRSATAPEQCPRCGALQQDFTQQAGLPGD